MKGFIQGMAVVAFFALLGPSPALAAETTISGTLTTKRVISRTISLPGDDPRHALVQTVREDSLTSSDPTWNEATGVAHEQSDSSAAGGAHRGYLVIRHKGGDETYLRYEGTDRPTGESSGREVSIEGTIQIQGGTGRFKGATGSGRYSGKATHTGSVINWEVKLQEAR